MVTKQKVFALAVIVFVALSASAEAPSGCQCVASAVVVNEFDSAWDQQQRHAKAVVDLGPDNAALLTVPRRSNGKRFLVVERLCDAYFCVAPLDWPTGNLTTTERRAAPQSVFSSSIYDLEVLADPAAAGALLASKTTQGGLVTMGGMTVVVWLREIPLEEVKDE